ncbi:MAG TPA: hypothetical protein PLN52_25000, partial [Opitutaceae bacterium]|nr:hypothetical protein [Opitutaceae bacterium]
KAQGEPDAIRIRGLALQETPGLIQLQIVEKWDGRAPLVIGGQGGGDGQGTNLILPLAAPGAALSSPSSR